VLAGTLAYRYAERFVHLFAYTDALAMGVYGVYGANQALNRGIAPEARRRGSVQRVGGGLIRDILVRERNPSMFKPAAAVLLARWAPA